MNIKEFSNNRKKSIAPGRTSCRPTDIMGRQFSVGQMNRRATSVGPSASSATPKVDPRPTKNPEYIYACAIRVEEFVRSIAPNAVLSPKAFASPTVKDFEVIWETLFHAFDRSKGKKIEELVPYVLKSLGYPIAVSKSALSAPGSTHSWPQIILALDWFVTMIQISITTSETLQSSAGQDLMQIEEAEDNQMLDAAKTFEWLCESYSKYMDFDDEGCNEVDVSLISKIQKDQEQQKEYNEKLRKEVEQISAKINHLKKQPSPLLEMKRDIEKMEQDEVSLMTQIKQLEEANNRLQAKSAEYEVFIKKKEQETQEVVKEIEELRDRVSKQTVTKEDISRLMNEKLKVEQMLENSIVHKNSVEQEVNNKEVQLDSLLNGLERIVHEYNNKVSEIVSIEDQQSCGVNLYITLNRSATKAEEICNIEHKKAITNTLLNLKQKHIERNKSLIEEGQQLESLYSQRLNETVKIQQQHVEYMSELERLRQECIRCKEAQTSLRQNGDEQLSFAEDEIQRLKQKGAELIQSVQQRLPEAEAAYQELARRCEQEQRELLIDQRQRMEIYKKIHQEVSTVFQQMQKLNEEAKKEILNLIPNPNQ
eukprot:g5531.t1